MMTDEEADAALAALRSNPPKLDRCHSCNTVPNANDQCRCT